MSSPIDGGGNDPAALPPAPASGPSALPPIKPQRKPPSSGSRPPPSAAPSAGALAAATAATVPSNLPMLEGTPSPDAGGDASEGGAVAGDAKAAWAARDFANARLELLFPRSGQRREMEEEGAVTLCRGEPLRLLLLVRRPTGGGHTGGAEAFQWAWAFFAADLRAEARLYVGGDGGGEEEGQTGSAPSLGRRVLVKGCNLTLCKGGALAAPVALSEEEQRLVQQQGEQAADLCYLVETTVDIKPRYLDRRLTLALRLDVNKDPSSSSSSSSSAPHPTTTTNDPSAAVLRDLWTVALSSNVAVARPRVLRCGLRVVEPLHITSSYAASSSSVGGSGGCSFVSVQVENQHPSQALLLEDVGFHLDHSLTHHASPHPQQQQPPPSRQQQPHPTALIAPALPQPRFDRTLGYHPFAPQALHPDAFAGPSPAPSSPHNKHPRASSSPPKSRQPGHRYLHGPSSLHRMIAATTTPTSGSASASTGERVKPPATTDPAPPLSLPGNKKPPQPPQQQPAPDTAAHSHGVKTMGGGEGAAAGFLTALSSAFRLHWVETAAFPLVIEPGARHGLVFKVEPLMHTHTHTQPTSPSPPSPLPSSAPLPPTVPVTPPSAAAATAAAAAPLPPPPPPMLRGPFWTPLTAAWRMQPPTLFTITTATAAASPPSPSSPFRTYASSTPPLFTDKLVAWDAAAPLAQDFALAVQAFGVSGNKGGVIPFRLNEARAVAVSIANLTGRTADLVLRVDKDNGSSSFGPHHPHPFASSTARRGSLGSSGAGGRPSSSRQRRGDSALAVSHTSLEASSDPVAALRQQLQEEREEDAGTETEEEEEEGEQLEVSSSYAGRFEEWAGPDGGARWERCSGSNVAVLNTVVPVGPLEPMDETTVRIHLLPLRPGLCRLSNLLLEDKRTQRVYRLERPLELYVTGDGAGDEDGASQ